MSTHVSLQGPRPFLTAPDPRRYFPAAAAEEARIRIGRCIERNEGPALLVGSAGCGKSLLLDVLSHRFRDTHAVARLTGAQLCTRRALLQTILFELGLPYRGLDEGELRLTLLQHLRGSEAGPQRVLLLVDEADSLPSRLLEELRVLTGIVAEGQQLVQLVLAGRPTLEERFADPQLDAFSQRLAVRAYLTPLSREETFRYVRSQTAAVGWDPSEWFTSECLDAVFQATAGVPRLVNQLGDQLIVGAEGKRALPLGADDVQRTRAELQQLPAPWTSAAEQMESGPNAV
ncbi:MAG: AAA family ATPase [Planctomycetales bacterium]|nr:AAA family ATPase [Planctomycetales bacterium]